MATILKFEELEIWRLSRDLSQEIFRVYTTSEIFSKDFRLKDQINGSSGSIMDNIAEGFERSGKGEFINFLSYSKGSAGELKSQLYRAFDRKYITQMQFDDLYNKTDQISKKIGAFINYLKTTEYKGSKFKNRN